MSIQLKRHHRERLKRYRRHYFGRKLSDKHLGIAVGTPKPCSCFVCGNPRRYFNEKTLAELRNIELFLCGISEVM